MARPTIKASGRGRNVRPSDEHNSRVRRLRPCSRHPPLPSLHHLFRHSLLIRASSSTILALATHVLLVSLAMLACPDLMSVPHHLALFRRLHLLPSAGTKSGRNRSCIISAHVMLVAAQQRPMLEGQNNDPVSVEEQDNPVPVYTSISLEKLSSIDETAYTFSAVLQIMFSWRDPRMNKTGKYISKIDVDVFSQQQMKIKECIEKSAFEEISEDCQKAMTQDDGGCAKPCGLRLFYGPACCDQVWVPGFDIPNILFQSQDRIFTDEIILTGTTEDVADLSAVVRLTRVQASFSVPFDFTRFPFDSQALSFQLSTIYPHYYMVPSIVGRGAFDVVGLGKSFAQSGGKSTFSRDEVTGWQIGALELTCEDFNGTSNMTGTTSTVHPDDPLFASVNYTLHMEKQYKDPNTTCTFTINVSRNSGYYIVNLMVPVMLTVLLSFTVFFAKPSDLEVRLSTVVTLFLALVAIQFVIADQLPRTSYTTDFGWLVLMSYMVMTIITIETVFVFYLSIIKDVWKSKQRLVEKRETMRRQSQRQEGEAGPETSQEEEDDGRPATSHALYPSSSSRYRGKGVVASVRGPFTLMKEGMISVFRDDEDHALTVAMVIDNVTLVVLVLGYIVGCIVIFVVN